MSNNRDPRASRAAPALLFGGMAFYAIYHMGWEPPLHGAINIYAAVAWLVLVSCCASLIASFLWYLGNLFDRKATQTPEGNKGTAEFVQSHAEIAHELKHTGWGPYWGSFKGEEIISDFSSVALTCGTSGSGKGIGKIQPNILSIRESKVIIDLKGDLACVLASTLRERGETVHILNLGDKYADILGESASYNPLNLLADNFWRPGGLHDITDDMHEFCMQLYPEPDNAGQSGNDNSYFRDGSRDLIDFATQVCVLIRGHKATFGDVAQLLSDRQALFHHAQWVCGRLEQVSHAEAAQ
ncbi:type IV secretory system conjugative DNA transfer family protein [uncultured Roseibium sp.]|uniref:type IV secretory system conjugative DNA transfer family protein n=1 Tax=uncultured Roseibium sp. TaxID=1936171 RepID=UPI00262A76B3|nr:type IV secretory system conjugative DNA transfer family protein [uncultured Roseibium sp.]